MAEDGQKEEYTKTINNEKTISNTWIHGKFNPLNGENHNAGLFTPGPKKIIIEQLKKAIQSCSEFVCISSFLIQESEITDGLLKIAQNGKRVYILTASEAYLKKNQDEISDEKREIIERYKDLLNKLSGNVLVRTADHLHSKFLIVDPLSKKSKGYLLTSNFTDRALTENLEICVELSHDQIQDLHTQFSRGFWGQAKQELMHQNLRATGHPPYENFPTNITNVWTIGQDCLIKNKLLQMIRAASNEILISSFKITDNHEVTNAIFQKAKSGVRVRILVNPKSQPNWLTASKIHSSSIEIRGYRPLLHAKTLIVDGKDGLVMTSNVDSKGLDEGFETGVILSPKQVSIMGEIFKEWFDGAPWHFSPESSVSNLTKEIMISENGRVIFKRIVPQISVDLGIITIKDAEIKEPKQFPWPKETDAIFQRVQFKWKVNVKPPKDVKS